MSTKNVVTLFAAALLAAVAAAAALPQHARADALPNYSTLPGTPFDIDRRSGTQENPHVDGTLVAYSDYGSGAHVRWFDLATGTGGSVPNPDNHYDFLPDVSGSWITFTRITSDRSGIFAFNVETGELRELDPHVGSYRELPAIGGTTVVWQDVGLGLVAGASEIVVHDLATGATVQVTHDGHLVNKYPSIAPDGSVAFWTRCDLSHDNCDLWQARRDDGWLARHVTASPAKELFADTDGVTVVYDAIFTDDSGRDRDVVWQDVTSGIAQRLALPAIEGSPRVSRGVAIFGSIHETEPQSNWDLWAFDIANNALYRLTETPEDETLADVSVSPDGVMRVVFTVANDVFGATFRLPARGDVTPPILAVSTAVTADATTPAGAVVTYEATATDDSDPAPVVACSPASGTAFAVGVTTVFCTATDAAGNEASATFGVTVNGASTQIDDLRDEIEGPNLKQGIENSLDAKLRSIQEALDAANAGDVGTACNKLDSFINEVRAQSGKTIAPTDADALIADAQRIKGALGCG